MSILIEVILFVIATLGVAAWVIGIVLALINSLSKSGRQRPSEDFRDETEEDQRDRIISDFIDAARTNAVKTGVMTRDRAERLITPALLQNLASLPQNDMDIVGEYGGVLATIPGPLRPLSKLPYPKEIIRRAIENLLAQSKGHEYRSMLQTVLLALDDFIPDEEVPLDKEENGRKWLILRFGVKS